MGQVIRKTILLLLPVVIFTGVSSAAPLIMAVGDANSTLSPFPGPYSTVTVTLDSTKKQAQVVVSGSTQGLYSYLLGGTDAVDLNINGPFNVVNAFSVVSNRGGMTSTHPISAFELNTAPSMSTSGFGSYNLSVKNFDTFGQAAFTIGFLIQNTNGTWDSERSVLAANNTGFIAAFHVVVYNPSCGTDCQTGYVAVAPIANPEPGSMLLTGIGLVSVVFLVRRRKTSLNGSSAL